MNWLLRGFVGIIAFGGVLNLFDVGGIPEGPPPPPPLVTPINEPDACKDAYRYKQINSRADRASPSTFEDLHRADTEACNEFYCGHHRPDDVGEYNRCMNLRRHAWVGDGIPAPRPYTGHFDRPLLGDMPPLLR